MIVDVPGGCQDAITRERNWTSPDSEPGGVQLQSTRVDHHGSIVARHLSNITISTWASDLEALPADVLVSRLDDFRTGDIFTGTYAGPSRGNLEQNFEEKLAHLYASADTPRLSGVQIKAPMFLSEDGELVPGTALPFAHMLYSRHQLLMNIV